MTTSNRIIRITCTCVDAGHACHVGGPVNVQHKSFDLPAPPEVELIELKEKPNDA